MNLRRPFFLLVLSALLPLVLLSALLGAAWIRDQQKVIELDALAKVDRIAALIDRELRAQIDILQAMAASPVFSQPLDLRAISDFAMRIQDHQPLWRMILLSDPDGGWLLSYPEAQAGPMRVLDPESHDQTVRGRQPTIGSIRRGPRNKPAFAVRVPVIRDGNVLCILSAIITPEAVSGLLAASGMSPEWIGAVVDKEGKLVARTVGGADRIGGYANEDALRTLRERTGGLYEGRVLEGWSAVFAFQTVPAAGWSVHTAIPREDYMAPIRRSAWVLGLGGSASLLLAALLVIMLWREVRRRREQEGALEEVRRLEALGLMTGGVAHDFNNLLMIMQGSAEGILRRSTDPARIRAYADAIMVAARRGQTLTRQLLAFGRRSPYAPVGFDLRDRAGDLLMLLQRSTRGDIRTRVEFPAPTWRIHADPEALEVALVNLAVNARDAMPGGGSLTVLARNAALSPRADEGTGLVGEFVAIAVTDTGTGITEEVQRRIFEPFFTTKPAGQGTGLGLSQVYGFARQSKGAVTVKSPPGKGTTFTLYLPRSREIGAAPPPRTIVKRRRNLRILMVEDNEDVAKVAREMLEALGFRVEWTDGGADAIAFLEREAFGLLLSDIVMEGLSGLELAELVESRWPDLPILHMTGYSEAAASSPSARWPLVDKPFTEEEILTAIEKALAAKSNGGPSP